MTTVCWPKGGELVLTILKFASKVLNHQITNAKTRISVPLILLPQKMCSYSKPERFHSQHVLKNEESDLSSCVNTKKKFLSTLLQSEVHIDLNFLLRILSLW